MLPPPGIFVGISPVDATCGDAVVNYRLQDGEKNNAPEGVRHSARGQTQQELTANYQAEVDKVLHSQFETARQLIVGYTPALYEKIGMPSFPLTIGSGHFTLLQKQRQKQSKMGTTSVVFIIMGWVMQQKFRETPKSNSSSGGSALGRMPSAKLKHPLFPAD